MCQSPSSSFTSPMCMPSRLWRLKRMVAPSEYFLNAFSSSKGQGGIAHHHSDLVPLLGLELRVLALGES